jgi:phytoene dehydrogenase-like protein
MQGRQAVVIGSGVAGLAVAIRLAVQGIQVNVFEKNSSPGGKISVLDGNGFRFDAGPSLFVQPENILELFRLCGENPHDYFEYVPLDIACRYFFENGITINALQIQKNLQKNSTPNWGGAGARKKYLARSGELYESLGTALSTTQFIFFLPGSNGRFGRALQRQDVTFVSNPE